MAEWFSSGLIIDVIIGMILLEGVLLVAYYRFTGRGLAPADALTYLLSGLCLMLAVRAALVDAGWVWVALWLGAGMLAHLLELSRRWRR